MNKLNNKIQYGVTLIEVLVTIIILAVGLLGLAAMQAQSLKFNTEAEFYSKAVFASNDLIGRVRSDANIDRSSPLKYNASLANFMKPSGTTFPTGTTWLDNWGTLVSNVLPVDTPMMTNQVFVCQTTGVDGDSNGDGIADTVQTQQGNGTAATCPDTNIAGELDITECNGGPMVLVRLAWARPRPAFSDVNGDSVVNEKDTFPCTSYNAVFTP